MHLDRLFGFAAEREAIRRRRAAGQPFPWTEDEILRSYKFTNVYREEDRTSQSFREIYWDMRGDSPEDLLLTAATFRYFGTAEFAEAVGPQHFATWDPKKIKSVAKARMASGDRVFTGAYVITNQGISAPKENVVVDYFLDPLAKNIHAITSVAQKTRMWKDACGSLMGFMGFGGSGFMAKETFVDLTYTTFWDWRREVRDWSRPDRPAMLSTPEDWDSWTPVGPGARRGAWRVMHGDVLIPRGSGIVSKAQHKADTLAVIMEAYERQDEFWPKNYPELYPHDIQFILCEYDKYERVRLGHGTPRSRYRETKK